MNNKKKLTVALCTYNREHYIGASLKSILNQTYKDYELLILDNASTDRTREVVGGFDDPRIKYMYFNENTGMTGNWLRAINLCNTEYLSIAHDDDIMEPTLFERELEILENNKEILLVSCRSKFINQYGDLLDGKYSSPFTEDVLIEKYCYFEMAGEHNGAFFMSAPAAMFRVSYLGKIDYSFFKSIGTVADTYWYLKINEIGKLYLIGDALVSYRIHQGQYSADVVTARTEHLAHILPLLATHLPKDETDAIREAFQNEIKALSFSKQLTDKYETEYSGFYLTDQTFVNRDLLARIKFLNHLARGHEKRYVIWGCGSAGRQNRQVFEAFLPNYRLAGYIDGFKTGEMDGLPIYSPESYDFDNGDYIVIATSTGGFDVMKYLEGKGLLFEKDFMIGNIERL